MVFLLNYTSWLGIFFSITIALIASFLGKSENIYKRVFKFILFSTIIPIIIFVLQCSVIDGFGNFIHSMSLRFIERSGYFGESYSPMEISIFSIKSFHLFIRNSKVLLYGFGYLLILLAFINIKKIRFLKSINKFSILILLIVMPTLIHTIIFFNLNVIHLECFSRNAVPISIILGILFIKIFENKNSILKYLSIATIAVLSYYSTIQYKNYFEEESDDTFLINSTSIIKSNTSNDEVVFANIQTQSLLPFLYLTYQTKRNIVEVKNYTDALEKLTKMPQKEGIYFELNENNKSRTFKLISK